MLRESRQLLKMQFAGTATEQQAINRALRSLIGRPPVTCRLETSINAALRTMHEAKIGSIIVVSSDNEPLGIFTRHDILDRVALARTDLEQPIATVMTAAPHVISAEASAHDAALTMAHHGIRHLPVVDGGRLIGVVTERDLFTLQRISMREIRRTIDAQRRGAGARGCRAGHPAACEPHAAAGGLGLAAHPDHLDAERRVDAAADQAASTTGTAYRN